MYGANHNFFLIREFNQKNYQQIFNYVHNTSLKLFCRLSYNAEKEN